MGGFATSAVMSAMQYAVDDAQRSARTKVEQAAAKSEAAADTAQIQQAQEIEHRDRQDRLRRTLATQRARFGAQGTGSGASSDAALTGLALESDREGQQSDALTGIRLQRVNDQLAWGRRKSLLDSTYPRYQKAISAVRQGISGVSLLDE